MSLFPTGALRIVPPEILFREKILSQTFATASSKSSVAPQNKVQGESAQAMLYCIQQRAFLFSFSFFPPYRFLQQSRDQK